MHFIFVYIITTIVFFVRRLLWEHSVHKKPKLFVDFDWENHIFFWFLKHCVNAWQTICGFFHLDLQRSSLPSSQHLMMVKKNAATAFKMCLPTYILSYWSILLYSYQIKTRRNLNNNSPIMGIYKKDFFYVFPLASNCKNLLWE